MRLMEHILIPLKQKGKNTDLQESRTLSDRDHARECFKRACKRMLNPPLWHKLAGKASADFRVTGRNGEEEHRLVETGDFLRIDVPGPGPSAGNGYDWVQVELIDDGTDPDAEEESMGLKLRASAEPGNEKNGTAHFLDSDATSSFIIQRVGNTVTASYYGRNERGNTSTHHVMDNIRNSIIALGALAGLSEMQWSSLIKAFLQEEIGG
jgi:hypothetical protein